MKNALLSAALVLFAAPLLLAAEENSPGAEPDDTRAARLVRQLGDDEFAVRERAARALANMGHAADAALQEGQQSFDLEIRFNCIRILRLIAIEEKYGRILAFQRDRDGKLGRTLPGWEHFKQVVGEDGQARDLFVEMYKAEESLLDLSEGGAKKASELLARRCNAVGETIRAGHSVSLGTICSLLFVALDEDVELASSNGYSLYDACQQPDFREAVEAAKQGDAVRRLLGAWIRVSDKTWSSYRVVMTTLRYDLDEGLETMRELLQSENAVSRYRGYELLALGKLGGEEDLPLVEKFFDDDTVFSRMIEVRNGERTEYEAQVRDVALAVASHLSGADPKTLGFKRIREHSMYLYVPGTLSFEDDGRREAAIAKWRELREGAGPEDGPENGPEE